MLYCVEKLKIDEKVTLAENLMPMEGLIFANNVDDNMYLIC